MVVVKVYISKYKLLKMYYQSYVDIKLFWLVYLYYRTILECEGMRAIFQKKGKKKGKMLEQSGGNVQRLLRAINC